MRHTCESSVLALGLGSCLTTPRGNTGVFLAAPTQVLPLSVDLTQICCTNQFKADVLSGDGALSQIVSPPNSGGALQVAPRARVVQTHQKAFSCRPWAQPLLCEPGPKLLATMNYPARPLAMLTTGDPHFARSAPDPSILLPRPLADARERGRLGAAPVAWRARRCHRPSPLQPIITFLPPPLLPEHASHSLLTPAASRLLRGVWAWRPPSAVRQPPDLACALRPPPSLAPPPPPWHCSYPTPLGGAPFPAVLLPGCAVAYPPPPPIELGIWGRPGRRRRCTASAR